MRAWISMPLVVALMQVDFRGAQSQTVDAPTAVIPVGGWVGNVATGYDDGGRRDPFVSLVVVRTDDGRSTPGRPPSDLAAHAIATVKVTGIARSGDAVLAVLEVPGGRSFVARPNERLLDGLVASIDNAGVTFVENTATGKSSVVRKALASVRMERP